jgi:hypothetical protein
MTHAAWPPHTDVRLFPQIPYTTVQVPPAGSEIVIERLRPNEQVSLSYLYLAPQRMQDFQTIVRFDEGTAIFYLVQFNQILPKWFIGLLWVLPFDPWPNM